MTSSTKPSPSRILRSDRTRPMVTRRELPGGLLLLLALVGALPRISIAAEDNAVVAEALRALFQSGKADTGSAAANAVLPSVREIYEIRDFKPIWVRDNGPK